MCFISIVQFSRIKFALPQQNLSYQISSFTSSTFLSTFLFHFVASVSATNIMLTDHNETVKYYFLYFFILFVCCFRSNEKYINRINPPCQQFFQKKTKSFSCFHYSISCLLYYYRRNSFLSAPSLFHASFILFLFLHHYSVFSYHRYCKSPKEAVI